MFTRSARIYDAVFSFKDYAVEAARVAEEARRRCPGARTLLDVACGTGTHLEHLRAHFEVAGVDLDPGLLEVARARLPEVRLEVADMAELDLGRSFDVVTCLFSSIGYVLTVERLHDAVAAMARHLTPGGVLIVEPWLDPDVFEDGRVDMLVVDEPELKVARMDRSAKEGSVSTLVLHYLIGTPGAGVVHEVEEHRLGLFTEEQYRRAFEDAGLAVEHDPEGLMGRGLYFGTSRA